MPHPAFLVALLAQLMPQRPSWSDEYLKAWQALDANRNEAPIRIAPVWRAPLSLEPTQEPRRRPLVRGHRKDGAELSNVDIQDAQFVQADWLHKTSVCSMWHPEELQRSGNDALQPRAALSAQHEAAN